MEKTFGMTCIKNDLVPEKELDQHLALLRKKFECLLQRRKLQETISKLRKQRKSSSRTSQTQLITKLASQTMKPSNAKTSSF